MAQRKGNVIYLKANDVFFEYVHLKNQELHRYGRGENPELNAFRYLAKGQWVNFSENIWVLDLRKLNAKGYNCSGTSELNNIGCFYEYEKDEIHGFRREALDKLQADWDFYQCNVEDYHRDGNASFDKVYLYLQANPNDLNVAISVGSHYGLFLEDSSVDSIKVKGFGTGGITLIGTCSVKDCRIDIAGGSQVIGKSVSEFVCLGNGIDFWLNRSSSDCIIEGNYISRCYDCGCSIQASACGQATPHNIVFQKNLISNCCQGWEDFLRNDPNVMFENCRFQNNCVIYAGISGFGYPKSRKKKCNVLGNNYLGDRGMVIKNNVFIGGNYYCSGAYEGKYRSNKWEGNIHYVQRGAYILSNYSGTEDVLEIPKKGHPSNIIKKYRELTNDKTTKFIICDSNEIESLSTKAKDKFIRQHGFKQK